MKHAALFGMLALNACNQNLAKEQDSRICESPPTVRPGEWGNCVHKWAYRLARSSDPAPVVARATVVACADAVAFAVNAAEANERVQMLADINRSTDGIAIFRVVQARAGHCDIPK